LSGKANAEIDKDVRSSTALGATECKYF